MPDTGVNASPITTSPHWSFARLCDSLDKPVGVVAGIGTVIALIVGVDALKLQLVALNEGRLTEAWQVLATPGNGNGGQKWAMGVLVAHGVDLHGLHLKYADLSDDFPVQGAGHPARLQGARMYWANIEQSKLNGANFAGATLQHAKFPGTSLRRVNFAGADLTNATLTDTDLTDATFAGAILDNTDFSHANLTGAIFSGACVTSVRHQPLGLPQAITAICHQ